MKFFIYSVLADGVGLAQQICQEGDDVMIYIDDRTSSRCGDGLFWKTNDWVDAAHQADITIFDQNGHGPRADKLRASGHKVWGGGEVADKLEHDRMFGTNAFRKAGIRIPETFDFSNAAEAQRLLKAKFAKGERMVIKLNDSAGAATSYLARDLEDMESVIESWETEKTANLGKGGILQKFVEGIEISVEGWFNGESFMYPFNWTMEDKKLLAGNLGPNVGCSQNIVGQFRDRAPRIAVEMLLPMAPLLKRGSYVGPIDVNTILSVEDGEFYALEHTPRMGYDATSTLVQGLQGYGEAVAAAVRGEAALPLSKAAWSFLGAVRAYIPPHPFECPTEKALVSKAYDTCEGVPITGWTPENRDVVLYDAEMKDEKLVVAGTCGVPYITLGKGKTVEACAVDVYRNMEGVDCPNAGYRTDLGERVLEALPTLKKAGIL